MEKLVVKTAVKTVLIILGIFLVVFAVFNLAFPQHMATITESTGNYALAVKYADLRYSYTKDCADLSRCFDDSVFLGSDAQIRKYGDKLVEDAGFEKVCEQKDVAYEGYDYERWVYSKIAVARYHTEEDKNEALKYALEKNGSDSFAKGNAVMSIASEVISSKDVNSAKNLCDWIKNGVADLNIPEIKPTDKDEQNYLKIVVTALESFIDGK